MGKVKWSGRVDSNHRPPGPETCDPRYHLDYRANIFARNFILSTKSTLVGGQLGGLISNVQTCFVNFAAEDRRCAVNTLRKSARAGSAELALSVTRTTGTKRRPISAVASTAERLRDTHVHAHPPASPICPSKSGSRSGRVAIHLRSCNFICLIDRCPWLTRSENLD